MTWKEVIHTDRIEPVVRPPKEPAAFSSALEAYEEGNYAVALNLARDSDQELYAMSLIMGGNISLGLSMMDGLPNYSHYSAIVRDYAYWCLGKDNKLENRFRSHREHPIDILIITMPNSAKGTPFGKAMGFNVRQLQLEPDKFGKPLRELVYELDENFTPQLALVIDCFGPYLPEDLFDIGFPVAIWVADHDYFLPHRYADLSRADLLVTNSASEHSELRACYDCRIAAFPGHDTYSQTIPVSSIPEKTQFDILFTGRAFVPYMRDKAQHLFRLATLEQQDIRISIVDGYLPEEAFVKKVRQARAVPIFWRYGGGIQTRAIDAMRQGTFAFAPDSGICRDFLGDSASAYHIAGIDLPENSLPLPETGAVSHRHIEELFWPSPSREERFLKFCLFQTLFIGRESGEQVPTHTPVEQRGYNARMGISVYTGIMALNMRSPDTAAHFNSAGSAGFYAAILSQKDQKLGQLSLEFFREGVKRFPENIALRFNLARVLWVYGSYEEAYDVFCQLIDNHKLLKFNASVDGLLSHRIRLLSDMFNYGDYYRLAAETLQNPTSNYLVLNIIISSAYTYLASAELIRNQPEQASGNLEKALTYDPYNFIAHRLSVETLSNIGGHEEPLLNSFFAAVNLYPPLLLSHGEKGIEAALILGKEKMAADIIKKFILFYSRTSLADGSRLGGSEAYISIIHNHRDLISGWVRDLADELITEGET